MNRVAHYLQEHLLGEVTASPEVRRHFAQDASILRLAPAVVVYPRTESDVRKTTRFTWQLAQRGRIMPITARGGGSDTSGAALGSGLLLVFTAHMNKILTLDPRKEIVTLEPGVTYDKLEQTLYTHGLFLPAYPGSQQHATIGGGIANNVVGEKSIKYGVTSDYVSQLRVVLANGEVIETSRLSKRELNRKLGLSTFEGDIYRAVDTLLEENAELIESIKKRIKASRNAIGYNLFDIKDGKSFDLTPLFVGSQGTLGIITEATLELAPYNPVTSLSLVSLDDLNDLHEVLPQILELKPSICDMVNRQAIKQVVKLNPNQLVGLLDRSSAAVHLFIEFDDVKESAQKHAVKKLQKIIDKVEGTHQLAEDSEGQQKIWKIRQSISTILTYPQGQSKAVPVAEDICVPNTSVVEFLHKAAEVYAANGLAGAAWGHVGDGVIHMQPVLDLAQIGDRQKLFKIANAIYSAAVEMDGSITAAAGDGRVRAPYVRSLYGEDFYNLILKVKKIFDPYGTLNPGVKTATPDDIKTLMRGDYSLGHHHEHLPRS